MTRHFALTLTAVLVASTAPLAAQQADFETTQLADGVFQFRFNAHNGLFVVTAAGVVAVDPISTTAAGHFADEIRRHAPGVPLLAIVYSHDHADHVTGAAVLKERLGPEAVIIAHANAHPKLVAAGDVDLPPPEVTFLNQATLHYGGRDIELHYLGRSHSDNMVVVFVPDAGWAFAVDFVANDRMGYRELPDYHFPDFFESLERLHALPFDRIAFGHGPPGDRASIERQIGYYGDLRAAVQRAVDQGLSEDEAAERITLQEYRDWGQYEAWLPMNVRAIYRWLSGAGDQGSGTRD